MFKLQEWRAPTNTYHGRAIRGQLHNPRSVRHLRDKITPQLAPRSGFIANRLHNSRRVSNANLIDL